MLLILGQPGIGKSTLITWITAHFTEKVDDILVYRFASDLKNIEWKSENITERILKELRLSNEELNEKILILDGYDEISVRSDRKEILDQLYWGLVKSNTIKCFSLIVTCRVNYIKGFERVQCNCITLQPWDKEQIESFCDTFCGITDISLDTEAIENIIKNKEILGVPLILYMVLALNISINKEGSIVDVYDKIFSLEGGIYDRCIENKSFADRHRVGKMKKQIHQLSREIAIWMFENNPDEAYIPAEEYKKICVNILLQNEDIEQDFIIGIFFKLKYCEGVEGEELYFVHRSIYEYFVAENIYSSVENSIRVLSDESQEELASNIAFYLKQGEITCTIGEYLQYKIIKLFKNLSVEKKERFYDWWESAVAKMLYNGMFYYTDKSIKYYKNIVDKECQCFENIIKILRLLLGIGRRRYMLGNVNREILEKYIRYCMTRNNRYKKTRRGVRLSLEDIDKLLQQKKIQEINSEVLGQEKIQEINSEVLGQEKIQEIIDDLIGSFDLSQMNLCGVNFKDINIKEIDLDKTNLSEANLEGANLREVYLREVDLEGANLRGADLRGANLEGANLRGADLLFAKFDEKQITYLENCDLSKSLVYVKKYDRFIDYLKYQEMKKGVDIEDTFRYLVSGNQESCKGHLRFS